MAYKNKEHMNDYMKQRYKERMSYYKSILGNKCVMCGAIKIANRPYKPF